MKRIIVVGATGTIGSAIVKELSPRHEIISVGLKHGDFRCDITSPESIKALYTKVGTFDAVISATGDVHFAPFHQMTPELYQVGLNSKLMGQVNLVLIGYEFINNGGSFTLTSGVLSQDPIIAGSAASMVNSAIEGFVRGTAIELPRGIRINAVSPTVVFESMPTYAPYFRGFDAVPVAKVALAYSKSAEGAQTGQVYSVLY